LFCHGAKQQLAQLATAPGAEENAVCLEFADSVFDLSCGVAFAHHGIAGDILPARHLAPGAQCLVRQIQRSAGIEVGHANAIRRYGNRGSKHVQQNQARLCLHRLFECKWHQATQIAQIRGDEEDGRMGPTVATGVRTRGWARSRA
jgi:hypothetical protein